MAGKGDKRRPAAERDLYQRGWDQIDWHDSCCCTRSPESGDLPEPEQPKTRMVKPFPVLDG